MGHFVRFLMRVWEAVKPPPVRVCEMIVLFVMIVGLIMTAIVLAVAHGLCWIFDRPFDHSAGDAAVGLLMLVAGLCYFVSWLREQWRESAEKDIFEEISESVTRVPVGCDPLKHTKGGSDE